MTHASPTPLSTSTPDPATLIDKANEFYFIFRGYKFKPNLLQFFGMVIAFSLMVYFGFAATNGGILPFSFMVLSEIAGLLLFVKSIKNGEGEVIAQYNSENSSGFTSIYDVEIDWINKKFLGQDFMAVCEKYEQIINIHNPNKKDISNILSAPNVIAVASIVAGWFFTGKSKDDMTNYFVLLSQYWLHIFGGLALILILFIVLKNTATIFLKAIKKLSRSNKKTNKGFSEMTIREIQKSLSWFARN